jgi:CspA family cold shock protein
MRFSDRLVRCEACGTEFVFTVREQRQRAEQGKPTDPPPFCKDCRAADVRLAEADHAPATDARADTESTSGAAAPASRGAEGATDTQKTTQASKPKSKRSGKRSGKKRSRGGRGRGTRRGKRGGRERKPQRQTELRIRHVGTVKWFDEDRGFGFIAQDDGEELFVHSSGVLTQGANGRLEQGQQVEYEIEHTSRGLQAVDVIPLP